MKVHELVDWLEKNADPEGRVFVCSGGEGAIFNGPARSVVEIPRSVGIGYNEYVISTEQD